MRCVSTWQQFFLAVPDFLTEAHPIEAMRKAGFTFDGVVSEALNRARPSHVVDAATIARLPSCPDPLR